VTPAALSAIGPAKPSRSQGWIIQGCLNAAPMPAECAAHSRSAGPHMVEHHHKQIAEAAQQPEKLGGEGIAAFERRVTPAAAPSWRNSVAGLSAARA